MIDLLFLFQIVYGRTWVDFKWDRLDILIATSRCETKKRGPAGILIIDRSSVATSDPYWVLRLMGLSIEWLLF